VDEEEFDRLMQGRPFGTKDFKIVEADARRRGKLSVALWGTSSADLQRQLLKRYPEIPSGFGLEDFRRLHWDAQTIATMLSDPRFGGFSVLGGSGATIFAAGESFTEWEARCEIVRRAIEYLEGI
jgi:hypothetical protein